MLLTFRGFRVSISSVTKGGKGCEGGKGREGGEGGEGGRERTEVGGGAASLASCCSLAPSCSTIMGAGTTVSLQSPRSTGVFGMREAKRSAAPLPP